MATGNHYQRVIQCYVCGSDISTTASKAMCEECREERAHERSRLRYVNYKPKIDADAFIVIYDPIPPEDGGFSRGALINREEMRHMLQPVCASFTVGTKLTNVAGEIYVVARRKGGGLKLIHV